MAFNLISSDSFTRRREDGSLVQIDLELFEDGGVDSGESLGTVGEIVYEQGRDTDDILTPIVPAQAEIELKKASSTLLKKLRAIDYHQLKMRITVGGSVLIEGPVMEDLSDYGLYNLTNSIRLVVTDGLSDTVNEPGEAGSALSTSIAAMLQQLPGKTLAGFSVDVYTEWQHDGRPDTDFFADFVRGDQPQLLSLQAGDESYLGHLKALCEHFGWRVAQHGGRWNVHEPYAIANAPDNITAYIDDGAGGYTLAPVSGSGLTLNEDNTIRFPGGRQSPAIGRFIQQEILADVGQRNLWNVWNNTFAQTDLGWEHQNVVFSGSPGNTAVLQTKDNSFLRQNGLTEGNAEFLNAWGLAIEGDQLKLSDAANETRGRLQINDFSVIDAVIRVMQIKAVSLVGGPTLWHDFETGEWSESEKGLDVEFKSDGTTSGNIDWSAAGLAKNFTTKAVPRGFLGYFEVEGRFDIISGDSADILNLIYEVLSARTIKGNSPTMFRKHRSQRMAESPTASQKNAFADRNPWGTNAWTFLPTGGGTAQSSAWVDGATTGSFGEIAARRKGKVTNGVRQKYELEFRDLNPVSIFTPVTFIDEDLASHLCLPVKIRREILAGYTSIIVKEVDLRDPALEDDFWDNSDTESSGPVAGSVGGGSGGGGDIDPSLFLHRQENLADLTDILAARANMGLGTTDDIVFASIDTGHGANELHPMNQAVRTSDAVTFASLNTGQGANQLHPMNQPVRTTDAVVFATLDTGHGANELYPMNQAVRTTDNVRFNDLELTGTVDFVNETNLQVEDKTITVNKNGTDGSSEGAGIIIERPGGNRSMLWGSTNGFTFDDDVNANTFRINGTPVIDSDREATFIKTTLTNSAFRGHLQIDRSGNRTWDLTTSGGALVFTPEADTSESNDRVVLDSTDFFFGPRETGGSQRYDLGQSNRSWGSVFAKDYRVGSSTVIDSDRDGILRSLEYEGKIESDNWTGSGFFSTGARLTDDDELTVENMFVRGSARFRDLIIDQLGIIAGSFLQSAGRATIATVDNVSGSTVTVTVEDPDNIGATSFVVDDFLWIKQARPDNPTFVDIQGIVINVAGTSITFDVLSGVAADVSSGMIVTQRGSQVADRQSLIYHTVTDPDNPFIRGMLNVDSLNAFTDQSKVGFQLGNLENLTSTPDFGALDGVGAYLQRGFIGGDVQIKGNLDVGILPRVSDEGLMAYFPNQGLTVSDTTNIDATKKENGSITSFGSVTQGIAGEQFRGAWQTDFYAELGSLEYTLNLWIEPVDPVSGTFIGQIRVGDGSTTTGGRHPYIFIRRDTNKFHIAQSVDGGGQSSINSNTAVEFGKQTMITVVVSKSQGFFKLYIDGKLDSIVNRSDFFFNDGAGWRQLNNSPMSHIRRWSRILSENEIKSLFVNPDGNAGGLITANTVRTGILESQNLITSSGKATVGSLFDLNSGKLSMGFGGDNIFHFDSSTSTALLSSWKLTPTVICNDIAGAGNRFITISTARTDTSNPIGFSYHRRAGSMNAGDIRSIRVGQISDANKSGSAGADWTANTFGIQITRGTGGGFKEIFRISDDEFNIDITGGFLKADDFDISTPDFSITPSGINIEAAIDDPARSLRFGNTLVRMDIVGIQAQTGTAFSVGTLDFNMLQLVSNGDIKARIGPTVTTLLQKTRQVGEMFFETGEIKSFNMPTSDPVDPGVWYTDSNGFVKVSSGVPPAPSTPTGFDVCKEDSGSFGWFTISWNSVSDADNYEVQRRVNGGSWSLFVEQEFTSITDQDPFNNQSNSYEYRVRACNAGGCSSYTSIKGGTWGQVGEC